MASSETESEMTEDEIDRLKLPKAMGLCKKHNIPLCKETKLQHMKWLLKRRLLCKENERKTTIESLDWDAYVDENRRKGLVDIYDNTIINAEYVMEMKDPVVEELKKIFPDVSKNLEEQKHNINEAKAPILVLGETGSGKSSFINLLLGEEILPCSLLSNTHVICEIRNSKDVSSYACLYQNTSEEDVKKIVGENGDFKDFKKKLADEIQAIDKSKRPVYKMAKIYMTSDILGSGVVIVDSPGIGEARDMENMVLEYILNACTFIYIIDSTSAGGMQDRMQKLVQKVHKKALDEQREYRPESALFICNKWDEVPYNERAEVWEDTVRKIKSCWPECQESQIYKFSTLEAAYIQDKGGMSPKFRPILQQISQLVPLGREILLLRGYKFLDDFASKCIHCFGTHLAQIKLTAEERKTMRADTTERLNSLRTKIESFFENQNSILGEDIKKIAKELGEYIQMQENMEKVCTFSDFEIPQQKEWKELAIAIRSHVYDKIMKMIKSWEEEENKFKKIGIKIADTIEEQFPKFESEIFQVQQKMSRSPAQAASGIIEEEEEYILPNFIRNKFKGLKFGMKVAVGIGLSPVLVVGMAVNLPVFGIKMLKRSVQTFLYETEYVKAKTPEQKVGLCNKYAKSTVTSITDKLGLEKVIEEDIQPLYQYLRQQRQRMERQIVSDLDLLKTLHVEERDDEDIERTYEPLQAKFEIICRRLRHFLFINLPERYATWAPEIPFQKVTKYKEQSVCSGFAADIVKGKCKEPTLTDGFIDICIRKPREIVQASNVKKVVRVQQAYSTIKQESIVRCFGVSPYEGILYQILEPLQCNLRSHLMARQEELRVNKANTVLGFMKDVVSGLNFLHDREKKLVSLDLSMDTVAVDANGVIKLTNISLERKVLLQPDYASEKITVGKYVHFHPRFFSYTTKTVPKYPAHKKTDPSRKKIRASEAKGKIDTDSDSGKLSNSLLTCSTDSSVTFRTEHMYTTGDDMYAVGVMMWELWKEKPLVSETLEFAIPGEAVNENQEGDKYLACEHMEKFMKRFQPKLEPPDKSSSEDNERFLEDWWATVNSCLDQKMSSSTWIGAWKDCQTYPSLTLVSDDQHFAKSP